MAAGTKALASIKFFHVRELNPGMQHCGESGGMSGRIFPSK